LASLENVVDRKFVLQAWMSILLQLSPEAAAKFVPQLFAGVFSQLMVSTTKVSNGTTVQPVIDELKLIAESTTYE
jgi:hypothetical protein